MWVQRELSYALRQKRYARTIVPLLYRQCDEDSLSWTLGDYQRVDFTAGVAKGVNQLLRRWKIRRR